MVMIFKKLKYSLLIYIRVKKREGTGITIFGGLKHAPGVGKIVVPLWELKRQEKYILDNNLNEKDANQYRVESVKDYCFQAKSNSHKLLD